MKRVLAAFLVLLWITPFQVSAQKAKGDACFKSYDYREAITYYTKAVKANSNDTGSLVHLADCYRILRDYDNAETYYAKAVAMPGISARTFFYYGEVLKNNGKIDEAKQQFLKASIMSSDSSATREVRYCNKLKQKNYVAYLIKPVDKINSDHTDFCPTFYNDDLVFVSDRQADIVNMSQNNSVGGNFFKLFLARSAKDGFDSPKEFPLTVNKTETQYNIGPVSFTGDGKVMYYTQVAAIRKKDYVNQAKLFYCEKSGNSWGKPQPMPFNSDSYSCMDAAISADGNTLYFSSDMPGGYGGCDIYVCQKSGNGTWSQPKNLGNEVNTPGNEVFPYLRKDGAFFFVSDRHFNYGGLDIFSAANKNGKWTNIQNLGPDINSSTDDFGICFNSNNRTGFFASNRKSGHGKDDLYSFIFIGDYRPLKGAVLFSYNVNDPVPDVEVHLLDEDGKIINATKTDTKGSFVFNKLDPDKKYLLKVNEDDPRFAGKKKFYLADSTGRIIAVTILSDKAGKFVFTQLPPDLTEMPKLDASDKNINIAGNLLQGDSSKPLSNAKVSLLNANGDVIQSVTTNAFGAFVFTQLPPDENYSFKVDVPADTKLSAGKTKVVLTDKNGNTIKTFFIASDGKFKFQVLASDTSALARMEVQDPELRLELHDILLSDQKVPLPNIKINMVDKTGAVLQSTTTDGGGAFSFSNLPADQSEMMEVDMNDPRLSKMTKLYVTDSKKTSMRELSLNNGSFKYELLPADKKSMGDIYVYDPWIEALNLKNSKAKDSMYIVENIYYDYEKADILPAASRVLDKVVKVMKADPNIKVQLNAFTDPRGSDDFNMQLSQKRADAAVAYMISHGVEKGKLIGKGLGKTHLLNDCGDPNVHCSEAEFAINRRTEFKIIRSGNK